MINMSSIYTVSLIPSSLSCYWPWDLGENLRGTCQTKWQTVEFVAFVPAQELEKVFAYVCFGTLKYAYFRSTFVIQSPFLRMSFKRWISFIFEMFCVYIFFEFISTLSLVSWALEMCSTRSSTPLSELFESHPFPTSPGFLHPVRLPLLRERQQPRQLSLA